MSEFLPLAGWREYPHLSCRCTAGKFIYRSC